METCISTMLTPAKHFLHAENKQPLTFVPDRWVQHNCWSDLRLSSGTQKNKWPASENGKVRWKSYGNSRGRRIPFSSYLRQDDASSSLCHHLPHPPIVSSDFSSWGVSVLLPPADTPLAQPQSWKSSGGSPHLKWHPGAQDPCSMAPDSSWAPHFANLQRRGSKCIEYSVHRSAASTGWQARFTASGCIHTEVYKRSLLNTALLPRFRHGNRTDRVKI